MSSREEPFERSSATTPPVSSTAGPGFRRGRWPGRSTTGALLGLGLALVLLGATSLTAENWPGWRGPKGLGISSDEPPQLDLSSTPSPAWRVSLDGTSTSTPVVWGDRVFVTSQKGIAPLQTRGDEEEPAASERLQFVVEAFRRTDGERIWMWQTESEGPLQPVHTKHNLASPSPVTDGERVIVWFATGQAVALSFDGEELWRRHLGKEFGRFEIRWAHGSSPLLHDEAVYFLCDHTPAAYLLAVDKSTGEDLWRVDRDAPRRSYTTPVVYEHEGRTEIIVNSDARIDAYDAATGELRWFVGSPARVPVSTPVHDQGILYTSRGYRSGPYMAVELGGEGSLAEQTIWRHDTGAPYVSSLLYHRGLVFFATENGIVTATDAKSGETVWRERLGGYFSASPIAAGDSVYLLNEESELFVVRASREFELVGQMEVGEKTQATPAISEGQLFIRTDQSLFAYGVHRPAGRLAAGTSPTVSKGAPR